MTITKQELFDKVATHLLAQKRVSTGVYPKGSALGDMDSPAYTGGCLYRGPDNTQCAFGCLIPDELYRPSMEGRMASSLLYDPNHSQLGDLYPEELHKIISDLQHLHDFGDVESWPDELGLMAMREGLNLNMKFEFKLV